MTLFTNEKNELIRKREFSFIEISFNEFKEKGNKLYNKGQYSKALEQYVEAYSLLKWIEVRDRTLLSYANIVQKQRAIVDGDIIKRSSYLNSTDDDDTFNDCICSILLSISYCFLQMRHYKNTVDCLDECLEIDENNVIALFRRSQELQSNVLKIMKNKYKFVIIYYREIQNEEQLAYAYDEVEYFMERYQKFKFYYMMNVAKVLETYQQSYKKEKDFAYLEDAVFVNFLKNYKNKKVMAFSRTAPSTLN